MLALSLLDGAGLRPDDSWKSEAEGARTPTIDPELTLAGGFPMPEASVEVERQRVVHMASAVTGLNHITLAVGDIQRSLAFYRDVLGCTVRAVWNEGAYLEAGSLWLCLSKDNQVRSSPHPDYTHIAFGVSNTDYPSLHERIAASATIWKNNRSEGASIYFLDPDGHKLEVHVGSLKTRLDHYRTHPEKGVEVFD